MNENLSIRIGDCRELLREIPDESVQCCVTSPPYWGLRDYGHPGQIGQEATPELFVSNMVAVFDEVRRIIRSDGTLWLNLGDSYSSGGRTTQVAPTLRTKAKDSASGKHANLNGLCCRPGSPENCKPKDLIGIPWMVAFALRSAGWYLRQDIIWAKPNPMPESVTDRCTKAHEYIFLLSKSASYYYDHEAIKEQAVCGWNDSEFQTGKTAEHQLGRSQKVSPSKAKGSLNGKTEAMADTGQNAFRAVTATRNKRIVWTVPTAPYKEAHFATYPPDLIKPCIMAGTKPGDVVLDPFGGSGTTGQVALELGRRAILLELNPEYGEIIEGRTNVTQGLAL